MDIKLGSRWDALVREAVQSGRFASAEDVVNEGLRLLEERERRLGEVRDEIAAALTEEGEVSEEELDAALAAKAAELQARGVNA
jgi:antitoxin ParD1/3/4